MIRLTKINGEQFLLNSAQIQIIEAIPESKILLVNKEYYIVTESFDEIIDKIAEFNARIADKESYLKARRHMAENMEK
ncbi:flagellar FlbD family protein [Clostridium aminobutyricum]|uniref:Flagellar FlbD family protein n=1 Tax=Clostridium aminobutyricum TaxID=33953 RepID=A0A939DAL4_CLOAM|nr:flagellar FlbD family protein [Clostridium aminobutyricum]MBN7773763.1 flagellar FlbD family protein [Clostridium aminobutyricum]